MACELLVDAQRPTVRKAPAPAADSDELLMQPVAVEPVRLDLEADPEATPSKTELDHDRQARINRAIDRARKR
jgi:hypothetical protein